MLAPLRAATENVYVVLELSPVTVFVPQVALVAHTAESPKAPFDCTYFVVAPYVTLIANSVEEGLEFSFTATFSDEDVGLPTVGALGTFASVQKSNSLPKVVPLELVA